MGSDFMTPAQIDWDNIYSTSQLSGWFSMHFFNWLRLHSICSIDWAAFTVLPQLVEWCSLRLLSSLWQRLPQFLNWLRLHCTCSVHCGSDYCNFSIGWDFTAPALLTGALFTALAQLARQHLLWSLNWLGQHYVCLLNWLGLYCYCSIDWSSIYSLSQLTGVAVTTLAQLTKAVFTAHALLAEAGFSCLLIWLGLNRNPAHLGPIEPSNF